jgi:L-ascorbate metabolism protein UlaG (beta-lactamase superfamily)
MSSDPVRVTSIGGPTVLLELGGLRLLTDPTFDPSGSDYATPLYTLHKVTGPAIRPEAISAIDAVLLSHDHHFDNLDGAGRSLLRRVPHVFTTREGAERLGGAAIGLGPADERVLRAPSGRQLRISATPARHGPPGGDRGPVIGFTLRWTDSVDSVLYISGDTVWYEGVEQLLQREPIRIALLFAGAARLAAVGPAHLTFTAGELVQVARACRRSLIVPLHIEGWAHYSESRQDVETAFTRAGLMERLRLLDPGQTLELPFA